MTELAVPEHGIDLHELARIANAEHLLVEESLKDAVQHACRVGEVLLAAREHLGFSEWTKWVEREMVFKTQTAINYSRFALFREALEQHGITTIQGALSLLRELGLKRVPRAEIYDSALKERAKTMVASGMTKNAVARELGVTQPTVAYWCDPDGYRKKSRAYQARRRAEKKALEREQKIKRAKASRTPISGSYALTRRLCEQLDSAITSEADREARDYLKKALAMAYRVEDALVRASATTQER